MHSYVENIPSYFIKRSHCSSTVINRQNCFILHIHFQCQEILNMFTFYRLRSKVKVTVTMIYIYETMLHNSLVLYTQVQWLIHLYKMTLLGDLYHQLCSCFISNSTEFSSNPFPPEYIICGIYSRQLLNNLWQKEELFIMYSFCHNVFNSIL